jgi:hypothetical protein
VKEIELTQGKFAIVDDEDYQRLLEHSWCFNMKSGTNGYAQRGQHLYLGFKTYKSKTIYMHTEILGIEQEIDHINGDTLDNRKENLRPSNRTQQTRNTSSRKNSSSKYVGVHLHKLTGKWRSQIKVDGKVKSLGLFASQEEAYSARIRYIEQNQLDGFKR